MKTKEFNKNYEIDRKARGVKATAKRATAESAVAQIPTTADGTIYDASQTYYFFDEQTRTVRQSIGLRRDGEHFARSVCVSLPLPNSVPTAAIPSPTGKSFSVRRSKISINGLLNTNLRRPATSAA